MRGWLMRCLWGENRHCVKFYVDFRILYEHPVCEGITELNLDIAKLIE